MRIDTIRSMIRLLIAEDAASRRGGTRNMSGPDIEKYIDDSAVPRYFFTMTNLDKVGLNPQSPYSTPAGVYTYPLDTEHHKMLVVGKLPFANEAKYCSVLERLDENPLVCGGRVNSGDPARLVKKEAFFKRLTELTGFSHETLESRDELNRFYNYAIPSWLFGMTYQVTRNPARWSKLLLALDYGCVIDMGHGVIHPNEPYQAVFMTPQAYRTVGRFETTSIRKMSLPDVLRDLRDGKDVIVKNFDHVYRVEKQVYNWIKKHEDVDVIAGALQQRSLFIPFSEDTWSPSEETLRRLVTVGPERRSSNFNYMVSKWLLEKEMETTLDTFLKSIEDWEASHLRRSHLGKQLPQADIPMSFADDYEHFDPPF